MNSPIGYVLSLSLSTLPVRFLPDHGVGKEVDDAGDGVECEAGDAGEGPEEPVGHAGTLVRGEAHLGREAGQVVEGLVRNVVEVDQVSDRVHEGEEQGGARTDLEIGRWTCNR